MANTILLKKVSTAGTAPAATSLSIGEVALNTGDGSLYCKVAGVVQKIEAQITVYNAVVDFGILPDAAAIFQASLPGCLATDRVICSIGGDVPGSMTDELEMDPLVVYGRVISTGIVEFMVNTVDPMSYVHGQRNINFYVG